MTGTRPETLHTRLPPDHACPKSALLAGSCALHGADPADAAPLWLAWTPVAESGPEDALWPPRAASQRLARHVAALASGVADVEVARSDSGEPYVVGPHPVVGVSLSHTHGWSFAVAGRGWRCGVDVEVPARAGWLARHPQRLAGVQRRVLSQAELDADHGLTALGAAERLLRRWVVKEAWAKAIGLGLQADLREAEVALDDDTFAGWREVPRLLGPAAEAAAWQVWRLGGRGAPHAAVVAARLHPDRVQTRS